VFRSMASLSEGCGTAWAFKSILSAMYEFLMPLQSIRKRKYIVAKRTRMLFLLLMFALNLQIDMLELDHIHIPEIIRTCLFKFPRREYDNPQISHIYSLLSRKDTLIFASGIFMERYGDKGDLAGTYVAGQIHVPPYTFKW